MRRELRVTGVTEDPIRKIEHQSVMSEGKHQMITIQEGMTVALDETCVEIEAQTAGVRKGLFGMIVVLLAWKEARTAGGTDRSEKTDLTVGVSVLLLEMTVPLAEMNAVETRGRITGVTVALERIRWMIGVIEALHEKRGLHLERTVGCRGMTVGHQGMTVGGTAGETEHPEVLQVMSEAGVAVMPQKWVSRRMTPRYSGDRHARERSGHARERSGNACHQKMTEMMDQGDHQKNIEPRLKRRRRMMAGPQCVTRALCTVRCFAVI